jgi:hypothetical protein
MPYTLSHPAAVLPFTKRGLPLSALVVGSMAPDFPYFLRWPAAVYGHTLPGIFFFCLPVGLLVLFVFHFILKRPLLSLLPVSHQERLIPIASEFRCDSWRSFLLIVLALLVGVCTHIVWDLFTHVDTWVFRRAPVLDTALFEVWGTAIQVYKLLQYGSTAFGLIILMWFYLRWLKQAPHEPVWSPVHLPTRTRRQLVIAMILFALITPCLQYWWLFPHTVSLGALKPYVRKVVISSMTWFFLELLVFSAFWHFHALKRQGKVWLRN